MASIKLALSKQGLFINTASLAYYQTLMVRLFDRLIEQLDSQNPVELKTQLESILHIDLTPYYQGLDQLDNQSEIYNQFKQNFQTGLVDRLVQTARTNGRIYLTNYLINVSLASFPPSAGLLDGLLPKQGLSGQVASLSGEQLSRLADLNLKPYLGSAPRELDFSLALTGFLLSQVARFKDSQTLVQWVYQQPTLLVYWGRTKGWPDQRLYLSYLQWLMDRLGHGPLTYDRLVQTVAEL